MVKIYTFDSWVMSPNDLPLQELCFFLCVYLSDALKFGRNGKYIVRKEAILLHNGGYIQPEDGAKQLFIFSFKLSIAPY